MRVRERVLDLLFPPKCPFCQKILAEPRAPVCPECRPGLPWLEGAAAERQVDFADGCFSPLAYRGTVPQAVHRYKFSRVRALGKPFAALMTASRRGPTCSAGLRCRRSACGSGDSTRRSCWPGRWGGCCPSRRSPPWKRRGTPPPSRSWRRPPPAGPTLRGRIPCCPEPG